MTPLRHPRIGVAGVGALGYHHARILAGMERGSLPGVYDALPERADAVASELGTRHGVPAGPPGRLRRAGGGDAHPCHEDVAVVLDLMIHDVDLVMSLVGRPVVELAASGAPVLTSSVDIANARMTFRGGAVANLTASRVSLERMRELRIFQASGYLSLNLAEGTGEVLRLRRDLEELQSRASSGATALDLSKVVERVPLAGRRRRAPSERAGGLLRCRPGRRRPDGRGGGWPLGARRGAGRPGEDRLQPCR